jgi:hypothetical protein
MKRRALLMSLLLVVPAQASPVHPSPLGSGAPAKGKDKSPEQSAFFADVMVLHATNSKKGVDARIGNMPELAKPPFSSYDSYELLERKRLPLEQKAPSTLTLPNGRVLRTQLLQIISKDALKFSASINQPNGKEFLPLLEVRAKLDQAFIVAGQSHKQGILVLVIRVVR